MTALAVVTATALAAPPAAWSNGLYFFGDIEGNEFDNTVYFGFVKDERKLPIRDAHITITIKTTNVQFHVESTPIGVYKSVHVPKDVDPKNVEVTVEAAGYTLVERLDRTMAQLPGDPVQIDFLMKPDKTAAR
jgi:hypothetical protein